jgi:hypothetical protein
MNKWWPAGKGKRLSKIERSRRKFAKKKNRGFLSKAELAIYREWLHTENFEENPKGFT